MPLDLFAWGMKIYVSLQNYLRCLFTRLRNETTYFLNVTNFRRINLEKEEAERCFESHGS